MRTKLKKILIVFTIVLLLFNILIPIIKSNEVYALTSEEEDAFDTAESALGRGF